MREELALALEASALAQAAAAARAIRDGWTIEATGLGVSLADLGKSVRKRHAHVSSFRTQHSAELAISLKELVQAIENQPNATVQESILRGTSHSFIVYAMPAPVSVFGCIRAVGKSQVSEAEWQDLWQDGPN